MKILLADPSEIWCDALEDQLRSAYTVLRCTDGADVLAMLTEHRPDLLVLDLGLPHVDGLTLLQMIRASGISVRVLVASCLLTDYALDILREFGVSYVVRKPCSVCAVMSQIYQLLHYEKGKDNTMDPDAVLLFLGLRMHLSGYSCLREGIRLLQSNPGQSITKELYPEIAKICGGSSMRVEKAIRNVIQDAWIHRDDRAWAMFFPPDRKGRITAPANGEFITRIAFSGQDKKACNI